MSFKKIQIINPWDIGSPDAGHIYFGRNDVGFWEKRETSVWYYITTGGTTGAGSSGISGSSGIDGVDGDFMGSSGSSGIDGLTGSSGSSGTSGKNGTDGTTGTSGTSGTSGTGGTSGKTGSSGTSGISGTSGSSGLTGSSGTSGNGSSGTSGHGGSSGTSGVDGAYGGATRTWNFYNSPDPNSGEFYSFGATNLSLVTDLIINVEDYDVQDVGNWLSTWSGGILKIEEWRNLEVFAIYDGCSPASYGPARYHISSMNILNSNGSLTSGKRYLISFLKAGYGVSGSSGSSGIGTSGTSGSSGINGFITDTTFYFDFSTDTLFTPNITLTGSTVTITNIQNNIDNNTKLILSGNILKQVTGVTSVYRFLTYNELIVEISGNALNTGESILITDYRTTHVIPNTFDTNVGNLDPLLVTAISSNELSPIAYSSLFPNDIIYYCPDNNQLIVSGCTKGYIYRRIDSNQNNDIPFDFRNVKFRRWQINAPTWSGSTIYNIGSVVQKPSTTELYVSLISNNSGNIITTSDGIWRLFEWSNLSYVSWEESNWILELVVISVSIPCTALYQDYNMWALISDYNTAFSNSIDMPNGNLIDNSNTVIFGANFYYNKIGANFKSNSIGTNFYSNMIGSDFYNNSIGSFYSNSVGSNFYSNTINSGYSNSIGPNFFSNSIGSFYNNSIGSFAHYNSIGIDFCHNDISSNFSANRMCSYSSYNTFGNLFNDNFVSRVNNSTIGNYFNTNTITENIDNSTIGNFFYSNTITGNIDKCTIGNVFSSNIMLNFKQNTVFDNFSSVDLTLDTHVDSNYNCQLFTNETGGHRLMYYDSSDVIQIIIL